MNHKSTNIFQSLATQTAVSNPHPSLNPKLSGGQLQNLNSPQDPFSTFPCVAIDRCRVCGNRNIVEVLDLGRQALTGRFPKFKDEKIPELELILVKCDEQSLPQDEACGLLQLKHTGDLSQYYGSNYGYRSGLNSSMARHLKQKVSAIIQRVNLNRGDWVIDIGSNDSTTLQGYPQDQSLRLIGIDPTGKTFQIYYPKHIELIPDFFSADKFLNYSNGQRAKVITSFSMFYDLPNPLEFMKEIRQCLQNDGIWNFEQSYLPLMLEKNSYDTVCHEHLEYYRLNDVQWMANRAGLKLLDVEFNSINGGSFSVVAAPAGSTLPAQTDSIREILETEKKLEFHTLKPYLEFKQRVNSNKVELLDFFHKQQSDGKKVLGYGASTKGNVLLQYCDLSSQEIPFIAEVNPDKWGRFTPGSLIPIISEEKAKEIKPDYFLVLPWHFRQNILERETELLRLGTRFVFPFPNLEIV